VTLLAERFVVARLATGCHGPKANLIPVAAQEIGSFVVRGQEGYKIYVAILAGVGCSHVVMACVACRHIRQVLFSRKIDFVQTLMACCTFNVFSRQVAFM
jgi:hypothetical protein